MTPEIDEIPPPPPGFVPAPHRGAFMLHVGPMFHCLDDPSAPRQAFFAAPRHGNKSGLVHGGMLAAFMDTVLAQAVTCVTGRLGLTIHLDIDYLHTAKPRQWLIGEGRVTRETRDIVFAEGTAWSGDRAVVRASGLFKMMRSAT